MKRKQYLRILSTFFGTPWAMLPEKMDELIAFIELKGAGHVIAEEDILAAMDMRPEDHSSKAGEGSGTVIINVHGTISHRMNMMSRMSGGVSTELLGKAVDSVRANKDIGRVILDVDSPGGAVPGTHDVAHKIRLLATEKEVITVYGGYGASAAYWIGSAATRTVAIPSAYAIGSIGAIFVHEVEAENGDRHVTVLRSVENKALINGVEKPSPAAIADMKAKLKTIHEMFVADIAEFRGVSVAHVNEHFGKGASFMAAEAKRLGLIDDIATLDEVLQEPIRKPGTTSVAVTSAVQEIPTVKLTSRIKAALVIAGYCAAIAKVEDFEAALALHAEAHGLKSDANEETILASFAPKKPATTTEVKDFPVTTLTTDLKTMISAADINSMVSISAVPAADRFALASELQTLVTAGKITTLGQVTDKITEAQAAASKPAGFVQGDVVKVTMEARDKVINGAVASIVTRTYGEGNGSLPEMIVGANGKPVKLADIQIGNEVREIPRIIETILITCHGGQAVANLSKQEMVRAFFSGDLAQYGIGSFSDGPAYNTTGLFRQVLYNANKVVARKEYGATPVDYTRWCPRGSDLKDFDVHEFKHVGVLSSPKAIGEDGEFSEMKFAGTESEQVRLGLWGGIYSYTWQMALADDLQFFTGVQRKMVNGISCKEDNIVHQYLAGNPLMADGYALFSTQHDNLLDYTGTVCHTEKIVREAKSLLFHQKDAGHDDARDGDYEPLQFRPARIIQPMNLEESANKYFDSRSPSGTAENSGRNNPHQNLVSAENRITAGMLDAEAGGSAYDWYMQGDPSRVEFISWHNLMGFAAPQIDTATSFDTLTMKIRIFKPFAVSAKDFRGCVKIRCNQGGGSSPT